MALHHDPARHVFTWLCNRNNIPGTNIADAASAMQAHVKRIRTLYRQPVGRQIPYDDAYFRAAYLIAYFPYYIEPVYHAMKAARLPDGFFSRDSLKVALFGGGPCPELLGLAAFLKERAPRLARVEATVFDRQPAWRMVQQELVSEMLPEYCSPKTTFTLDSRPCDVVECLQRPCTCGVADMDLIIAQNFLTEIYTDRERAVLTFERLITGTRCRYLVFVENNFHMVREMMDDFAARLHDKRLTTTRATAAYVCSSPGFTLPEVLRQHLFTGEDGLIAKSCVKFHHLVLEIAR